MLKQEKGFSMVEVLVTLAIMGIGLLGVAATQLSGFRGSVNTMIRTQATTAVFSMSEQIRGNLIELAAGGSSSYIAILPENAASKPACGDPVAGCTSGDMAENDLYNWQQLLGQLPLGQGRVTYLSGMFTVSITWDSNKNGARDLADQRVTLSFK